MRFLQTKSDVIKTLGPLSGLAVFATAIIAGDQISDYLGAHMMLYAIIAGIIVGMIVAASIFAE